MLWRITPRHTRINLWANLHLRNIQSLNASPRSFSARNDPLLHTQLQQALADLRQGRLHPLTRFLAPKLGLHLLQCVGIGGGINENRPFAKQGLSPSQSLRHLEFDVCTHIMGGPA